MEVTNCLQYNDNCKSILLNQIHATAYSLTVFALSLCFLKFSRIFFCCNSVFVRPGRFCEKAVACWATASALQSVAYIHLCFQALFELWRLGACLPACLQSACDIKLKYGSNAFESIGTV